MTDQEKLALAIAALKAVAAFDHTPECNCSAPVYECVCWDKSQRDIAQEALNEIDPSSSDL